MAVRNFASLDCNFKASHKGICVIKEQKISLSLSRVRERAARELWASEQRDLILRIADRRFVFTASESYAIANTFDRENERRGTAAIKVSDGRRVRVQLPSGV